MMNNIIMSKYFELIKNNSNPFYNEDLSLAFNLQEIPIRMLLKTLDVEYLYKLSKIGINREEYLSKLNVQLSEIGLNINDFLKEDEKWQTIQKIYEFLEEKLDKIDNQVIQNFDNRSLNK